MVIILLSFYYYHTTAPKEFVNKPNNYSRINVHICFLAIEPCADSDMIRLRSRDNQIKILIQTLCTRYEYFLGIDRSMAFSIKNKSHHWSQIVFVQMFLPLADFILFCNRSQWIFSFIFTLQSILAASNFQHNSKSVS